MQPGEPEGPSSGGSRRRLYAGLAVLLVTLVGVGAWLAASDDDKSTTTTTPSETTTVPTQPAPTTANPTTVPPSTTLPVDDPALAYVGLVYRDTLPAGVEWIGGALLPDDLNYAVSWVETPDGEMFWLERLDTKQIVDGLPLFEVIDAVIVPPGEQDVSNVVILGDSLCEIDGIEQTGVVAVFRWSDTGWFDEMLHGWFADLATEQLMPATGSVRCIDESFGV